MAAKDQALFSANELRSLENTIAFYISFLFAFWTHHPAKRYA
jgi:hypothetical protein